MDSPEASPFWRARPAKAGERENPSFGAASAPLNSLANFRCLLNWPLANECKLGRLLTGRNRIGGNSATAAARQHYLAG